MPTSDFENKDIAKRWITEIAPESVVDVGAGSGTYRKLYDGGHWTAVESWAPYVDEFELDKLYQDIIISDVRYLNPEYLKTDLIIAGDVLEHLKKEEARLLIDRFKSCAENIIIAVPLVHLEQAPYEGNWFEVHKDHWTYEEMCDELADGLVQSVRGDTLGYFLWEKE